MNVSLFVDVGNLYYCVSKRFDGRKLDYEKLREKAAEFGTLQRAFAYGTQISDEAINFITCLKKLGYDPKYKKPKQIEAEGTKIIRRANWSVGIAMDIVTMLEHKRADIVIISSADPDLVPVVQHIKNHGVRCIVLACGISKEMKDAADQYIEIGEDFLEVQRSNVA